MVAKTYQEVAFLHQVKPVINVKAITQFQKKKTSSTELCHKNLVRSLVFCCCSNFSSLTLMIGSLNKMMIVPA